jgi:hypothetical protein
MYIQCWPEQVKRRLILLLGSTRQQEVGVDQDMGLLDSLCGASRTHWLFQTFAGTNIWTKKYFAVYQSCDRNFVEFHVN